MYIIKKHSTLLSHYLLFLYNNCNHVKKKDQNIQPLADYMYVHDIVLVLYLKPRKQPLRQVTYQNITPTHILSL